MAARKTRRPHAARCVVEHVSRSGIEHLEAQVAAANPNVAAAVARHDEASAYLQEARSGLFPTIGAEADVSRQRQSDNRPLRGAGQPASYDSKTADVGIGYDLDLWGKMRNQVSAGRSAEEASADDLQSVRLSLQASLASTYFDLRGLDQRANCSTTPSTRYKRALKLTVSRHNGGMASGMDVSRAQTQLASARAAADDTQASRALLEHAIATLTGTPASTFTVAVGDRRRTTCRTIPTGMPPTLCNGRPDIAAAERRVAAANAKIGVARRRSSRTFRSV